MPVRETEAIILRTVVRIVTSEFPTITYTEALQILKEKEGMDIEWGKNIRYGWSKIPGRR